jgi:hypothetical protein
MTVEVYVSLDGLDYERLDLMKSESILMKYIYKDTQDLSKIYSPYSQSFALEGSLNNQRILGFLGETKILKTKANNNFDCKIYNNGLLAKKGLLEITEARYEIGKIKSFTANFTTSLISLKDRMGEDKVSDLGVALISWTSNDILRNNTVIPGIKYTVPFISNNRIWQVEDISDPTKLDNIAYNPNADKNGDNFIKINELAPALQFRNIIDLIKSKYELDIVLPLESEDFYNDLYVYCNKTDGSFVSEAYYKPITTPRNYAEYGQYIFEITSASMDLGTFRLLGSLFPDNQYEIELKPAKLYLLENQGCYIDVNFHNVQNTKSSEDITIDVSLEDDAGNTYETKSVTSPSGSTISGFDFFIPVEKFFLNSFFFNIKVKSNVPIVWNLAQVELFYKLNRRIQVQETNGNTFLTNKFLQFTNDNNSSRMGMSKIDLFKSLPDLKIVDFLTSFFKTFNISVFESAPDDGRLYWLTPKDIEAENKEYSKSEVDYTDYVVEDKVNKKIASDYNYYNFKHKQGKYKGNADYLRRNKKEYGQLVYPTIKPAKDLKEFKVETNFTILENVEVSGLTNVKTSYGFTSEKPTLTSNNALRYKANTEDFTLMFYNGTVRPSKNIGYLLEETNGNKSVVRVNFNTFSSVHKSGFSLGFGLIETATQESLYENYYKNQTDRLLEPNTLQHTFTLELPPNKLVLNYANTVQGQSQVPSGFRLQNDIIILETRYSIIDATIDQTTGKTTLNLLNYV